MINEPDAALTAALRRLADEVAPRLLAQALSDAEAEVKEQLRAGLVRHLNESIARAGAASPAALQPLEAASPPGWYVYGITEGDHAGDASGLAGVESSTTDVIVEGRLGAVVSEVAARRHAWGMGEDGEPDLEVLAPRLGEHEAVLEHVLQHGTVLPMRFGTVYPSRQSVHDLLAVHTAEIAAALVRVRDKLEWGLSVTWDVTRALAAAGATAGGSDDRLAGAATGDPADAGEAADAGDPAGPGRGYLSRQAADRARVEHLDRARQHLAAGLHDSIGAHAAESVVQRHRERDAGGDRQPLLRAAYLVDRSHTDGFRHAIVAGLEAASGFGVDGELTGPWPPYSFATLELAGAAS